MPQNFTQEHLSNEWPNALRSEFSKEYYASLYKVILNEYKRYTVYPPMKDIYNAFEFTPLSKVKCVILGQDPYHEEGQAHGLAFSVQQGVDIPPSLMNIYHELQNDIGCYIPNNGCLIKWAEQGVLLLNTVLTVRAHLANSHRGIGWEEFTDAAIQILERQDQSIVYLLWGASAKNKQSMLHNPNHLVLTAPHPSPLSAYRGFFGCRHFSQTNDFLISHGQAPIDWQIENI